MRFVRPIAEWLIARVTAAAQAQARFTDNLRLAVADLQRVRTIGFDANRAILAQDDFHDVDCNRVAARADQGILGMTFSSASSSWAAS